MGPRHPMARFYAQHVIICRQAARLSRSLLSPQLSTINSHLFGGSARANSQASFTPAKHSAFLVQAKLGAAVKKREEKEKTPSPPWAIQFEGGLLDNN